MNARPIIASAILSLILTQTLRAQPAPPQLSGASLNTVQRGQSAELGIRGTGLAGATAVSLPNPGGLTAELIAAAGDSVRVKVAADAQAAVGPREVRVIGPTGVSNPLSLYVSEYPPFAEAEPNDDRSAPQDVRLPAVLVGAIGRAGDADFFRFEARKGERLVVDVAAEREGSMLDAVIALHNTSGREVANGNDHFGKDPFLAYEVASDGVYTLSVRDLKYRGGDNFTYRVTAGPIPYLQTIYPISGQRGKSVEVEAVGYNLESGKKVSLNLADAGAAVPVRAPAGAGESNAKPLEVLPVPVVMEAEPNDAADKANAATLPGAVNGRIDRGGDRDSYSFTVDQPQKVAIEAYASRYGSPVDPLLTLHDAQGKVLARNDDPAAAQYDARIVSDLPAGKYTVTVEDLLYGGSPAHVYRLSIGPDTPPPQNFVVRFQPDALRVSRGGHTKLWCEVIRANGYAGEVTVAFEGLPPGVAIDPVPGTFGPATSGVFTLAASPQAPLGTIPVKLIATGPLADQQATRVGQPQIGQTVVQQAYLTVFEPAPFTVRAVNLTPELIDRYAAELASIEQKLATPTPELHAAAAEWEKSLAGAPAWIALDTVEAKSQQGATLAPQPDGSILATGANPATDVYTITTRTDLKGITAVKLEALADPSLPANGPGRAINGNFVLSTFGVQAAPATDPTKTAAVALHKARADFSQDPSMLSPEQSLDANAQLGWAIAPQFDEDHWAIFQTQQPIAHEGGTTLTFTLTQAFGGQHAIGRLRLSATTAADVKEGPSLPKPVAAAIATPPQNRTPEQKDAVTRYYMTFAPQLEADRRRATVLLSMVGPARQAAKLEAQLAADNPQVDAAQAKWELAMKNPTPPKLSTWQAVGPFQARTNEQAFLQPFGPETTPGKVDLAAEYGPEKLKWAPRETWADGQVNNIGDTVRSATYLYRTVEVDVPRRLALSLGSDDGIKVWHNGKQVLANPAARAAAPDQEKLTLDLQPGVHTLLIKVSNGNGLTGFYFKPEEGASLPEPIAALVNTAAEQRTPEQKAALRAYYRSIDPSLKPVHDRLAALKARIGSNFPPVAKRKETTAISVAIEPQPSLTGPVTVTLEGFVAGRDPATGLPAPTTGSIDFKPLMLSPSEPIGLLSLTPKETAELGQRTAVLRAEAKVGDATWVQYSPAFPLTVQE